MSGSWPRPFVRVLLGHTYRTPVRVYLGSSLPLVSVPVVTSASGRVRIGAGRGLPGGSPVRHAQTVVGTWRPCAHTSTPDLVTVPDPPDASVLRIPGLTRSRVPDPDPEDEGETGSCSSATRVVRE